MVSLFGPLHIITAQERINLVVAFAGARSEGHGQSAEPSVVVRDCRRTGLPLCKQRPPVRRRLMFYTRPQGVLIPGLEGLSQGTVGKQWCGQASDSSSSSM